MTPLEFIQVRAYAKLHGLFMGLLWIASFACFVEAQQEPGFSMLFDVTLFMIPVAGHYSVCFFRDKVLGGTISFRRAFLFLMMIFFYATLLLALSQWAYFQFLDNGTVFSSMISKVNDPQFAELIKAYGMTKDEVLSQLRSLSEVRPIDFAFSFMWLTIGISVVMSWMLALFAKRTM